MAKINNTQTVLVDGRSTTSDVTDEITTPVAIVSDSVNNDQQSRELLTSTLDGGDNEYKVYARMQNREDNYKLRLVNLVKFKNDLFTIFNDLKVIALDRFIISPQLVRFKFNIYEQDVNENDLLFCIGYPTIFKMMVSIHGTSDDIVIESVTNESNIQYDDVPHTYIKVLAKTALNANAAIKFTLKVALDADSLGNAPWDGVIARIGDNDAFTEEDRKKKSYSMYKTDEVFATKSEIDSKIRALDSKFISNISTEMDGLHVNRDSSKSNTWGLYLNQDAASRFNSAVYIQKDNPSSSSGAQDRNFFNKYLIVNDSTWDSDEYFDSRSNSDYNDSYTHYTQVTPNYIHIEKKSGANSFHDNDVKIELLTKGSTESRLLSIYPDMIRVTDDSTSKPLYLNCSVNRSETDGPVYLYSVDSIKSISDEYVIRKSIKTEDGGFVVNANDAITTTSYNATFHKDNNQCTITSDKVVAKESLSSQKSTTLDGTTSIGGDSLNISATTTEISGSSLNLKSNEINLNDGKMTYNKSTNVVTISTNMEFQFRATPGGRTASLYYDSTEKKWIMKGIKVFNSVWN